MLFKMLQTRQHGEQGEKKCERSEQKIVKVYFWPFKLVKMVMENSGKSWNLKAGNAYQPCQMTIAGGELASTGVVPHNWGTLYVIQRP